jgi:L-cysteine desulfidase
MQWQNSGIRVIYLKKNEDLLRILKSEITPALGCTEPIAVAYSVAVAKKYADGTLESIDICVDPYLYKNALNVGIPGTGERGAYIAAVLGYLTGDADKKYEVLKDVNSDDVEKAKEIVNKGRIKISINEDMEQLFIETVLVTDKEEVKVLTLNSHLNIEEIQVNGQIVFVKERTNDQELNEKDFKKLIQNYTLNKMKEFADNIPLEKILFLQEGVRLNKEIAEEGLKLKSGIGKTLSQIMEKGIITDNPIIDAQILASAAAEARMSGSKNSVMSSTGSGNQGITIFLTLAAFAERNNYQEEDLLRALVLTNLIAIYIKSYLGSLSSMCGAAISAGSAVSAGIVYLMHGNIKEIFGAILNMFASITGLICDGAKEGCAYKVALTVGWAIEAALLSLNGSIVNCRDGILSDDFEELVKNMAYINNPGMVNTNQAILKVIEG